MAPSGFHLASGAPWRNQTEQYGNLETVYSRLRRLREAGIWERMLPNAKADAAKDGELDGSLAMIAGINVRDH